MRKVIPGLAAASLLLLATVWGWHRLPPEIVSHWGADGTPDGTAPRATILLLPAITLALPLFFSLLLKIDPRRAHHALHSDTYWFVVNTVMVFLSLVGLAVLGVNIGLDIPLSRFIYAGAGILLMLVGNVISRIRSNWFIGIRTPWTLASDNVWRQTHRLGARLMVLAGLVTALAGIALPLRVAFIAMMASVVTLAVVLTAYSYFLWRREQEGATTP